LAGLVEVDETSLAFRVNDEPARPGRAHEGKLLLAESGVKLNIPRPCTRGKSPGAQAGAERSLTRSGR
jgi:hypothetical protein